MLLEEIFAKYGIKIKNQDGSLRNVVDVLEDMYLKLSYSESNRLFMEIGEEEKWINIFDEARNRKYRGAE
jgi:hypothetical protein